jgi:hypothetical protein
MSYLPLHEHHLTPTLLANADIIWRRVLRRSATAGKTWANRIDTDQAVGTMKKLARGESVPGVKAFMLHDSHLFVCSFGSPWWANTPWLIEQFYMRVDVKAGPCPIDVIDQIAKDNGCTSIVFGSSLSPKDEALGRLLSRSGYSLQSSQFIKEI